MTLGSMHLSWMRPLRDLIEVGRQASVLLLRSRTVVLLAALALLFAAVLWALAQRAAPELPGDELFGVAAYLVLIQFALPFVMLYLGVAAVHGDIEDRSVTFLLVRPVHRASVLLGKWLAVAVVGAGLTSVALGLAWLALYAPELPWRRGVGPEPPILRAYCLAGVLAASAYAAVGACFGAWFRRPLVLGVVFLVGWEFLVAAAPPQAGVRAATVADPIRRWLLHDLAPTGQLREVLMMMNLEEEWLREGVLGDPLLCLARFTAIMLALALWAYVRREHDSRARE